MPKPRVSIQRSTNPRSELFRFLGPKNFKGVYAKNPLAYTPGYHKYKQESSYTTAYPVLMDDKRGPSVNWKQVFTEAGNRRTRFDARVTPFAGNTFCKTNSQVSAKLKAAICEDQKRGISEQQISFKYSIALPRVEGILKLAEIERRLVENGGVTRDMRRLAETMRGLFPEIRTNEHDIPDRPVDNMTEIPIPEQTRHQKFMTIAESEPFGPLDAAQALNVEPASVTLEKLTQHTEADANQDAAHKSEQKAHAKHELAFYGPVMKGDRSKYRFVSAKVGQVGHRYGASKDDRKHARKVKYTPTGKMVYA